MLQLMIMKEDEKSELIVQLLVALIENSSGESHEDEENHILQVHIDFLTALLRTKPVWIKNTRLCTSEFAKKLVARMFPSSFDKGFMSRKTRGIVFDMLLLVCSMDVEILNEVVGCISLHHSIAPLPGDLSILFPSTSLSGFWEDAWESNSATLLSRSNLGVGGISNPGCVCYVCSTLQVLFMMPAFRESILDIPQSHFLDDAGSHEMEAVRQLQLLYAYLQESVRAAVDPRPFCSSFFDFNSRPIDLMDQQDASEFMFTLLQRIETATMGTKQGSTIQDALNGELSYELCADGGLRSERKEPFQLLAMDVGNAANLSESFSQYISSETVDYTWEVPNDLDPLITTKKTLKSSKTARLKKLPRYLLLHLKRFNFDVKTMQHYKVHKRFEFPMFIDMYPYTAEAAEEKKQGSVTSSCTCMYELTGVVIHSGQSTGGHYYAFVREEGTRQWLEINDGRVSRFDIDTIDEEAFGGDFFEDVEQQAGNSGNGNSVYNTLAGVFGVDTGAEDSKKKINSKLRSAFMLVYNRVDPRSNLSTGIRYKAQIPNHLSEVVQEDNLHFFRSKYVFSDQYLVFVTQLLLNALESSTTIQSLFDIEGTLKTSINFLFGTLLRARIGGSESIRISVRSMILKLSAIVAQHIRQHSRSSEWFLASLSSSSDEFLKVVFFGAETIKECKSIMTVLVAAVTCLAQNAEEPSYRSLEHFSLKMYSSEILNTSKIFWKGNNYYWQPMEVLSRSWTSRNRFESFRALHLERLLSFFLAEDSPYFEPQSGTSHDKMSLQHQPTLTNLVQSMSNFLTEDYSPNERESELLGNHSITRRLVRFVANANAKQMVAPIFYHSNTEKKESTRRSIDCIVNIIRQGDDQCKPAMRIAMILVNFRDSLTTYRIDHFLTKFAAALKEIPKHGTSMETCLDMLLRISKKSRDVREWIFEHAQDLQWINSWLTTRKGAIVSVSSSALQRQTDSKSATSANSNGYCNSGHLLSEYSLLFNGQSMNFDKFYDSDDEKDFLLGKRVKVRFSEAKWFSGIVDSVHFDTALKIDIYKVRYDDGEILDHPEFPTERIWKLLY